LRSGTDALPNVVDPPLGAPPKTPADRRPKELPDLGADPDARQQEADDGQDDYDRGSLPAKANGVEHVVQVKALNVTSNASEVRSHRHHALLFRSERARAGATRVPWQTMETLRLPGVLVLARSSQEAEDAPHIGALALVISRRSLLTIQVKVRLHGRPQKVGRADTRPEEVVP
jgi:hypothetical protein